MTLCNRNLFHNYAAFLAGDHDRLSTHTMTGSQIVLFELFEMLAKWDVLIHSITILLWYTSLVDHINDVGRAFFWLLDWHRSNKKSF